MNHETSPPLELDDIQSGVLRPRPSPYAATYLLFRIDDRAAGRGDAGSNSQSCGGVRRPTRIARRRDTWR